MKISPIHFYENIVSLQRLYMSGFDAAQGTIVHMLGFNCWFTTSLLALRSAQVLQTMAGYSKRQVYVQSWMILHRKFANPLPKRRGFKIPFGSNLSERRWMRALAS